MKYFLSSFLYFLGVMLLGVICFIVFEGQILKASLILSFAMWTLLYTYTDKLVLIYLNAREVIDTDEQELFQRVKNEVYKTDLPIPKIYTYNGNSKNCFVTESRGTWSIVFEKNLLKNLTSEQLEALVKFTFQYKLKAAPLVQTKVMGLSSFAFIFVCGLIRNFLALMILIYTTALAQQVLELGHGFQVNTEIAITLAIGLILASLVKLNGGVKLENSSIVFRVFSLFLLGLARPVFAFFDMIAKREKKIQGELALLPIVNRLEKPRYDFDQLMVDHLKENFSIQTIIVEHLESFPVLENCSFE